MTHHPLSASPAALSPRRWPALLAFIRFGLIGALSLTYAVLILVYFFRVEGGGFGSIAEVRALFMSDPVLVAGWVHYLAFDLFIGTWIAVEAEDFDIDGDAHEGEDPGVGTVDTLGQDELTVRGGVGAGEETGFGDGSGAAGSYIDQG